MNKRVLFFVKNLYTMERIGVMQVSAMAKEQQWETSLVISDSLSYEKIMQKVEDFSPSILAFSVMSPEYPAMASLARKLWEDTKIFTLFGGSHPTFFQDIIKEPFIRAIAVGEADYSFPLFLEKFSRKEEYTYIPGFHFHIDENKIIRNPPAPLIEDLDTLPFPDRTLMATGDPLLAENKSHIFFSSRGCPNACTYCFNHTFNRMFKGCGKIIRRRSVENLLTEMEDVKKHFGLNYVYIDDDIFPFCTDEWLNDFATKYPARIGLPFMCNVHANFVNEEKISLLKKAGCNFICFGIECGDEHVANSILKRRIKNNDIIHLSGLLHKHKIKFITQNILALPVDHPLQTDLKTLDLNIECRPSYAVAHIFYPLPGTKLTEYATDKGFFHPDSARMPERTNSFTALDFPNSKEKIQVERLQKLFGLVVSFPFLRPFVRVLIKLPLRWIYTPIFVLWYGFSMRMRLETSNKSQKTLAFFFKSFVRSLSSFCKVDNKQ